MKLKLAEIRERQGKSQSDVAKASGLQVSAVSHFECGRRVPTLANLVKMADALGVSLDALAGRIPTCLHGKPMDSRCPKCSENIRGVLVAGKTRFA